MNSLAPSFLNRSFLILAGNEDMHESLDEFKFRPELSALARLKN